jgi:probable HAF family extracellular repeat protein
MISRYVVGYSTLASGYRAFLWDGAAMVDLGTLGVDWLGESIGCGHVVGSAYNASNDEHAFCGRRSGRRDRAT